MLSERGLPRTSKWERPIFPFAEHILRIFHRVSCFCNFIVWDKRAGIGRGMLKFSLWFSASDHHFTYYTSYIMLASCWRFYLFSKTTFFIYVRTRDTVKYTYTYLVIFPSRSVRLSYFGLKRGLVCLGLILWKRADEHGISPDIRSVISVCGEDEQ